MSMYIYIYVHLYLFISYNMYIYILIDLFIYTHRRPALGSLPRIVVHSEPTDTERLGEGEAVFQGFVL